MSVGGVTASGNDRVVREHSYVVDVRLCDRGGPVRGVVEPGLARGHVRVGVFVEIELFADFTLDQERLAKVSLPDHT